MGRTRELMNSQEKFDEMIKYQRVLVFFMWYQHRKGAA